MYVCVCVCVCACACVCLCAFTVANLYMPSLVDAERNDMQAAYIAYIGDCWVVGSIHEGIHILIVIFTGNSVP